MPGFIITLAMLYISLHIQFITPHFTQKTKHALRTSSERNTMKLSYRLFVFVIYWLLAISIIVFKLLPPQFFDPITFDGLYRSKVQIRQVQFSVSSEELLRAVVLDGHGDDLHRNKSSHSIVANAKKRLSREQKLERALARARASIRRALADRRGNLSSVTADNGGDDYIPSGDIYRNPRLFHQSYLEMERRFKVYVYQEGEPPFVHYGPCKDIYSIEGRFLHEMEQGVGMFRTHDPNAAHVYFMPFSVTWMVKYLYTPPSKDLNPLRRFVSDYVRLVSTRYPYWNRTHGADHFMLACHDWGPHASEGDPFLYNTSIRVLCNANTTEGFDPRKDVSLPEIHLYGGEVSPKLLSPPPDNATRPHLAFFAGGLHGPIRPNLLHHWKNHDKDLRVYEYLPKGLDYYSFMLSSKFCLCPSGYEVASPRIVEAIYAECVPVILSQHYVLPFSDVLRWQSFSVQMDVSDIPRLKEILGAIPENKYRKLKEGVRAVRKHFTLNHPAKKYDVFHMILHSIWLRRLNVGLA